MEEDKSKSQKKREAAALQQLGVQLIELSEDKLDRLPLSDALREAIFQAKKLRSHGARRRQAQLIGKLMRQEDGDAILVAYNHLLAEDKGHTALFHHIEKWRERLIQEGNECLTLFIQHYPDVDIQTLRQLILKAKQESQLQRSQGAQKALFRFLRAYLS